MNLAQRILMARRRRMCGLPDCDRYWDHVVFLLSADDPGGVINDRSNFSHTVDVAGGAEASNVQEVFAGNPSISFVSANALVSTHPSAARIALEEDFTLEAWVFIAASTAHGCFLSTFNGTQRVEDIFFRLFQTTLRWHLQLGSIAASVSIVSSSVLNLGTWHHLAVSRVNGYISLFQDGVFVGGAADSRAVEPISTVRVGRAVDGWPINGYIDELRITKGVARYTADFTPPTAPFPTTGP